MLFLCPKPIMGCVDFLFQEKSQFFPNSLIFASLSDFGSSDPIIHSCGCGEIGRRTRLRIWRREACRFDPCHPHKTPEMGFFYAKDLQKILFLTIGPIPYLCSPNF